MSELLENAQSASRSVIIPSLRYRDAYAAIDWLVQVFGFTRQAVYEGPDNTVAHAQLTYGGGMLMLGSASNGGEFADHSALPSEIGGKQTAGLCLVVQDCDALYAAAKAAGAEIVQELNEPEYGGKAFACKDPEGYVWWVGSYDPWAEHPTA